VGVFEFPIDLSYIGSADREAMRAERQRYKTWNEAVAAERRCAGKLRRRGYGVWSG